MTDDLKANLDRLRQWCRAQDPNATIWLHINEAEARIEELKAAKERLNFIIGKRDEQLTAEIELSSKFCREKLAAEAKAAALEKAVQIATAVFREYERMHMAKDTREGQAKAQRNRLYAEEMELALARNKEQENG